jgi:GTP-binding protein
MLIKKAEYLISSPSIASCPAADRPEFAFIGRSNVGKSSLINMLTGQRNLAKTSATPGKTQLINHFTVESDKGKWYLVDLPGYGYAKVSAAQRKKWAKMIEDYVRQRQNLGVLFVLVDGRHSPQSIDLEFIRQLGEWQVPFSIVFTKADKETQRVVAQHVREFLQELKKEWTDLPPHFVTSAEKKLGKDAMLRYLDELLSNYPDA